MSIAHRRVDYEKRCFRYCGDDRCNCSASPQARGRRKIEELRRQRRALNKAQLRELELMDEN